MYFKWSVPLISFHHKATFIHLLSLYATSPATLNLLNLISRIVYVEEYKS